MQNLGYKVNMMKPYAVIATGGKQYRVESNNTLSVERLEVGVGEKIEIKPVLAISDGTALTIGKPNVKRATVTAVVAKHIRGEKVISFKKKRRKGYSRKIGHRQELTVLKIESLKQGNG